MIKRIIALTLTLLVIISCSGEVTVTNPAQEVSEVAEKSMALEFPDVIDISTTRFEMLTGAPDRYCVELGSSIFLESQNIYVDFPGIYLVSQVGNTWEAVIQEEWANYLQDNSIRVAVEMGWQDCLGK